MKNERAITLTPTLLRALTLLRDKGPMAPSTFGHEMWPKHATYGRELRAQGAGYAGGAYLSKLQKRDIVWHEAGAGRYRISPKGLELLKQEEARDGAPHQRRR